MIPHVNIKNYSGKEQKTAHDLNQIIDAINDNDGNDRFRIMMAIVKAKKLNDSDLVKKLEVQGEKAKENERIESEKELEVKYSEYEKVMEERRIRNRVAVGSDKVIKKFDVERKSKIASESPVKKNWDLFFITHIDNLQHVTKDGIVAPKLRPMDYKKIANKDIADFREKKIFVNHRPLDEYAHVYFRPDNAMLAAVLKRDTPIPGRYRNYSQYSLNEIVIIKINIDLTEHVLYMVDRNAVYATTEDFVPSHRYMEIIPSIEAMLKETGWYKRPNGEELKKKFMAECHILSKFPLNSLKAICIADEHSIKKRGYNFAEFKENVKNRISPESVLTSENIVPRGELFFGGLYG